MSHSQKTIAEGITIIKEALANRKQSIKVRNDRDCPISIAIDTSQSRAVTIEQSPLASVIEVTVPPKETAVLATLKLGEDWNIVTKYKISLRPPESDAFNRQLTGEKRTLTGLATLCLELIRKLNLDALSDEHFRDRGISNFVDPYFPPDNESVFRGSDSGNLPVAPHWRRPAQFFLGEYSILPDELEPGDIKSGQLSDGWLTSALSAIAERPQLIHRLFLSTEKSDFGLYRLRICKDGEWRTVVVDDYFPCYPNLAPMFSRAHGSELWVLLVEKAVAKIAGSYLLLKGGYISEALSDLTGCPTLVYDFELQEDQLTLWTPLSDASARRAIILATAQEREGRRGDRRSGFVPGRGYVVLQAKEALGEKLINVRSEADCTEWDGDWSENSRLWTDELQAAFTFDRTDGTFWMSFNDFMRTFTRLTICYPEAFYEARLKGKFLRVPATDGRSFVVSKFYYCFSLTEKSRIFLSLHQEDKRIFGADTRRSYLDLGLMLFRRDDTGQPKLLLFDSMKVDREVALAAELEPGNYIVVPRTSGCALRHPPSVPSKLTPLLSANRFSPLAESTFRDLFRKHDMMLSGDLSLFDLRALYDSLGLTLSDSDFDHIKEDYSSTRDGITVEGFLDLMEKMTLDRGETFMRTALEKAGYDRDFYSVKSRVFVLTLHSDKQAAIEIRENVKSNLTNIGWVQHIKEHGETKRDTDVGVFYSYRETDYEHAIGTYMVENKTDRPVRVTVDVTGCQNVALSTLTEVNNATLEPQGAGVLLHFQLGSNAVFKPRIEMVLA